MEDERRWQSDSQVVDERSKLEWRQDGEARKELEPWLDERVSELVGE